MSFLDGHYIPKFDPTTGKLPDPGSLKYKMFTHDIGTLNVCDLEENRYKIENFSDVEEGKVYPQIYCWKGIISKNPDCKIGTVCDPYSFSGARTRFCLTWGGCEPHLYVADDKGQPIVNERGGIIVYTKKADCEGGIINQAKCFVNGIRQSADYILDPENRRSLIIQMVTLSAIVTIGLIIILRVRGSKNKKIVKIRKMVTPRFAKTKPIFR
jgi:hypothetical protein